MGKVTPGQPIRTVAADYFTIEPSGAISFWVRVRVDGNTKSSLILAVGAGHWKEVEMIET